MTASVEPSAADRAPQRRVPDFFIVGHPKCGTTALTQMLNAHPQVFMCSPREPRFLTTDMRERVDKREIEGLPNTLEAYLSLFDAARPEQRAGEATTVYIQSLTAASQIAELQPAARIVVLLREPASFLRSLHLQYVQQHVETEENLRDALALEDSRRRGERIPSAAIAPRQLLYSELVRYVEQLRRYYDVFPAEQILVIVYEDFRRDNEGTLRQVHRFLDIDDTCPVEVLDANPTVGMRSMRLHKVTHAASCAVKAHTPNSLWHDTPVAAGYQRILGLRDRLLTASPPPPDEELMLQLRLRFKGEVAALSEYLGRDLVSLWGYDGIG